jgi:alpha-D-xyloside xylohydrolase
VFKRWLAFGLLSSHSRLHGSGSYRVPWAFDDEAVHVARKFTRLKMSLMPYLTGAAAQVQQDGTPMLRPMVLEFPHDPATEHVDTQYMLGDSLLVAPVFAGDGRVRFYVPGGGWTSLLDGSTVAGPRWVEQTHGFDSVPLLVRPGAVIPIGARDDRPDYDYADGVTLALFGIDALTARSVRVPALGGGPGATFQIDREGATITIGRTSGADLPWSVRLPADVLVAGCTGAELVETSDGIGSTLRAVSGSVGITLMSPLSSTDPTTA